MRPYIYPSPDERPVTLDHQHNPAATFHNPLGADDLQDALSLHLPGRPYEGLARGLAAEFPRPKHRLLGVRDESLVEPLVNNAPRDSEVYRGVCVLRVEQQATPRFDGHYTFKVGNPILAKSKEV